MGAWCAHASNGCQMEFRCSHPWPHHPCLLIGGQHPRPASPVKYHWGTRVSWRKASIPHSVWPCNGYRKSIPYFEEKHNGCRSIMMAIESLSWQGHWDQHGCLPREGNTTTRLSRFTSGVLPYIASHRTIGSIFHDRHSCGRAVKYDKGCQESSGRLRRGT